MERRELAVQQLQRRAVVAGANLAGVAKRLALVVAHQQRAEVLAGALGGGVPADDELLLQDALDLEPVGGARADVAGLRPLRDDPFGAAAQASRYIAAEPVVRNGVKRIGSSYQTTSRSTAFRSTSGRPVRSIPS